MRQRSGDQWWKCGSRGKQFLEYGSLLRAFALPQQVTSIRKADLKDRLEHWRGTRCPLSNP
jgi:hypothetical protein